jgi:hypothetical protein
MTPLGTLFLHDVLGADGQVEPARLALKFRITKAELAIALGLSRDAVTRTSRLKARATQARLHVGVEIINQVPLWAGSVPPAFAWSGSLQAG